MGKNAGQNILERNEHVSSECVMANRKSVTMQILLIKMTNNRGLKIKPCGTPH